MYLIAKVKNKERRELMKAISSRVYKGNAFLGTLVQESKSIYNEGCISCKKEINAYRLTHRAFCARIPP